MRNTCVCVCVNIPKKQQQQQHWKAIKIFRSNFSLPQKKKSFFLSILSHISRMNFSRVNIERRRRKRKSQIAFWCVQKIRQQRKKKLWFENKSFGIKYQQSEKHIIWVYLTALISWKSRRKFQKAEKREEILKLR